MLQGSGSVSLMKWEVSSLTEHSTEVQHAEQAQWKACETLGHGSKCNDTLKDCVFVLFQPECTSEKES